MFKNAMIFTIPPTVDLTAWLDPARPVDHVLKPVGPMEISSVGFVPPVKDGADPAEYAVKAGDYTLITVGTQVRRLPGSAVDAELAEREDLRAEIVARLFLTASTIGNAFDALKPALKFSEGGAA